MNEGVGTTKDTKDAKGGRNEALSEKPTLCRVLSLFPSVLSVCSVVQSGRVNQDPTGVV